MPHLNTKFQDSFQHVCIIASSCLFIFKVWCTFLFLSPFSFWRIVVVPVYKCFHEAFVKNLVKKVLQLNTKFQHSVQHVCIFASPYAFIFNFHVPSSLLAEGTANTWWILLHNDRKSRHRRIKKQRRYERLRCNTNLVIPVSYRRVRQGQGGWVPGRTFKNIHWQFLVPS